MSGSAEWPRFQLSNMLLKIHKPCASVIKVNALDVRG